MATKEELRRIIETLRRQRVRQDDFMLVLDCLIEQSNELSRLAPDGALHETAEQIRARAVELQRIARSVPKFVVEDLIDEAVARLESLAAQSTI